MTTTPNTMRVVIPLTVRRRNGRPKILPPEDAGLDDDRDQDARVLRAIARAWSWRRQLESGAVATIQDIATAEKLSDQFVSRMIRLAYLSPDVLEQLVLRRRPVALSLIDLADVAGLPWAEQRSVVFERLHE
jgi:hypothetical protein